MSLIGIGSPSSPPPIPQLPHQQRLRDEHLNGQQFESLLEARVLTEDWRLDYNLNRPHSAHGWLSPVEFVEAWLNQQQLALA